MNEAATDGILPWGWLLLAGLCLSLAAFGTVAETVMVAGARFKTVTDLPDKPPTPYQRLLDRPDFYLSTALLISRLGLIAATVLATAVALGYLLPTPALVVAVLGMSAIVIVVVEIVPRSLAAQDLERAAQIISAPLRVAALVMTPFLWTLGLVTNSMSRFFGLRPMAGAPLVTEAELLGMLEISRREGIIEQDEQEMISGIFELEETLAREVMVPRIDMIGVNVEASLDEVVEVMIRHGYSRVPLYEENLDHIIGILYVKDVLRALHDLMKGQAPVPSLRVLARPAYFIPETKRINELLHELQARRVHLAIVVDEYGGTAGLATIEDLLEEIVGEIQDEFDAEEAEVVPVNADEVVMSGRASVDELQERFGFDVSRLDFDTVGGFVSGSLGRMPAPGDVVLIGSLKLTVLDVLGNRIRRVRVERLRPETAESTDQPVPNAPPDGPTGDRGDEADA